MTLPKLYRPPRPSSKFGNQFHVAQLLLFESFISFESKMLILAYYFVALERQGRGQNMKKRFTSRHVLMWESLVQIDSWLLTKRTQLPANQLAIKAVQH